MTRGRVTVVAGLVLVAVGVCWLLLLMRPPMLTYSSAVEARCVSLHEGFTDGRVNGYAVETRYSGGAMFGGDLVKVEKGEMFFISTLAALGNLQKQIDTPLLDIALPAEDAPTDAWVTTPAQVRADCAEARAEQNARMWMPGGLLAGGIAVLAALAVPTRRTAEAG